MSKHQVQQVLSAPVTWQVPVTTVARSIAPAWILSTAYVLGQVVTKGGNLYRCITAGTSAGSGGPTGTSTDITDGTAHWAYLRVGTVFPGSAILRNLSTSASVLFYGDSTLTVTNGAELPQSQGDVLNASDLASIFAMVASGTATATVIAYP